MERCATPVSCSYTSSSLPSAWRPSARRVHRTAAGSPRRDSCLPAGPVQQWRAPVKAADESRGRMGACQAAKREAIDGYTPAAYITYSTEEQHRCHHMVAVEVDAPAHICFDLWNDWNRLVDFLDLVTQIGLDPTEPDMGLFQCFYRWGRLPVMEIVFLAQKTHVEPNKLIQFTSVWGLPAQGEVSFIDDGPNRTTVIFKFEHQMPQLLLDLKIGVFGVESHMRTIFSENLTDFKELAETLARDPSRAPPRKQGEASGRSSSGASSSGSGAVSKQQAGAKGRQGTPRPSSGGSSSGKAAAQAGQGQAAAGRKSPGRTAQAAGGRGKEQDAWEQQGPGMDVHGTAQPAAQGYAEEMRQEWDSSSGGSSGAPGSSRRPPAQAGRRTGKAGKAAAGPAR